MRIGIVRGENLNRFEMQSYEPLASRHELTAYATYRHLFEIGLTFPVRRLHSIEDYYRFLPDTAYKAIYGLLLPSGMSARMIGLERELEDKDIIHAAETYNCYSYQAARVRKRENKRLVLTVWENIPFVSTWYRLKGFVNNQKVVDYTKDNTDIFLAVTRRAKMALMIEGVPEERIRVVPVGIDIGRFKPAPADTAMMEKLGVKDSDFVVLFVARLIREKGINDLLNAFKLIDMDPELAHVKLVIAGTGAEKDNIIKTINNLGIGHRVRLSGGFSYDDVPRLYNAADVFILPSIPIPGWQEQFGMVLLEAMASGLPVISTMSGSIPEVVGDAGVLIQPNDPPSIYEAMKTLSSDTATANHLASLGRKRAEENFSLSRASGRIESVYRELQ